MLYKIQVTQGSKISFTIPSQKKEKWLNETELKGATKLAEKLNENNSVLDSIPTILIKVLDSKQDFIK